MTTSATYTTNHLYLFPLPAREMKMELYRVVLGAQLASAGSATLRMALYRLSQAVGTYARRPSISSLSPLVLDPLAEMSVEYYNLATGSVVAAAAITNTTGWFRAAGTFERTRELELDVVYFLGLAVRQQSVVLAAPTDLADMPSYQASNQNPGAGAFPATPTLDAIVRTPAMTLLSPYGAATFGM